MKLSKILAKEIEKSSAEIVIKPVPKKNQPSYESCRRADEIIGAQVKANEVVIKKSRIYAEKVL